MAQAVEKEAAADDDGSYLVLVDDDQKSESETHLLLGKTPNELKTLLKDMETLSKNIASLQLTNNNNNNPNTSSRSNLNKLKLDKEEEDVDADADADKDKDAEECAPLAAGTNKEWKQVEDDDEVDWKESTFTFLYMSGIKTQAFWYAIFIYSVQLSTTLLTLIDTIDWHDQNNRVAIPPMVGITVTIAQGITMFLMLSFQTDLIQAFSKLQDGYYPALNLNYPGATYAAWLFSCLAQLVAGSMLLVTIFVLTMQVQDVISMMLNFAALSFLADIDNLGFALAKNGFVTDTMRRHAKAVVDFKVPRRVIGRKGRVLKRTIYVIGLVLLYSMYGAIKYRQLQGWYLQTYIYVQFGDAHYEELSYYSGIFTSGHGRTASHRQYRDMATNSTLLAYCKDDEAWTFSRNDDPCDFFAISPRTISYDVTSIPDNQWLVKDSLSRLMPFDSFTLVGRDCDPEACQGECTDDVCHCAPDRFGLDCEFSNVCPELLVMSEPFPSMRDGWAVSEHFELFRDNTTGEPIRVYGMPVFYSNKTFPANVIFFGGRRWVMTEEATLLGRQRQEYYDMADSGAFFPQQTAMHLQNESFHGYHDNSHHVIFLSDTVTYQTMRPTPAGLGWYGTVLQKADGGRPIVSKGHKIDAVLACETCNNQYYGFCNSQGGTCNATTGLCECNDGYSGDKCSQVEKCFEQERPCFGNGICDLASGECRCFYPHYGATCDSDYWCIEEYGKCLEGGVCDVSGGSNFACDCLDPATTGAACELRKDCTFYGCENGGSCNETTHACECPRPFYGYGCQLVNATLDEHICRTDADCVGGGNCDATSGTCTCESSGRYGSLCEHEYDCTKSGCHRSGGLCDIDSHLCKCIEPYFGPSCSELPDCVADSDCFGSNSECDVDSGTCKCKDVFRTGKLCEISEDCRRLDSGGCLNNGICDPNGFCECRLPFRKALCHWIMDDEEH
ncbi:EGF-like domain [Seminavis robusta]|uniref:EGF-like domain n=1 Tax=Seminavis robusta TaxID=568900 RepID=A0A9N8DJG6_9STRA|nr:EGF-like domain [Seminavis robusta]|eukprot:Sro175_g077080.1 EGF-like domain (954) ;mRNA; r:60524-63529